MHNSDITIIGGKSGYTEIVVEERLQIINTDEANNIIDENLKIISELEKGNK